MDKVILQSLASDLKRITLSIQRNSLGTAERFNKEAQKWLEETKRINRNAPDKLIHQIEFTLKQENSMRKAEDCLMYSVLLKNRTNHLK